MVGRAGFLVRLLAAAAVLVGCAAPPADASAAWVAANAIPLRGVDPLADGADLVPLAAAIGDAQVVGLGEAVHGVAEEITAKHRLLRLLVEQAGFLRPAPPAVRARLAAPATFRGVAARGDAGFLDGGSPTQWFDLVVFHRTATPAGMP